MLAAVFTAISVAHVQADNATNIRNSHAEQNVPQKVAPRKVFAKLFETLATRPGVTEPYIVEALRPAALKGGRAMMAELQQYSTNKDLRAFTDGLQPLLEKFARNYAETETGVAGLSDRVELTNDLYLGVLAAAKNARIPLDRMELSFLRGSAWFEKGLEQSPTEGNLTAADRELIDLLLLGALHQLSARVYIQDFSSALEKINPLPVPNWPEKWEQAKNVTENDLKILISDLESDVLSDPAMLADANELLLLQLNELAISDLMGFRIGLSVYFSVLGEDYLQSLADRMNAIGSVMSGMTVGTLLQSGLFGTYDNPYSGGPIIHLDEIAIYDWGEADMQFSYRPLENFPIRLALLGGEVPEPPDFNLFDVPYLPLFQMEYDLDLCDAILKVEKRALDDQLVEEFRPICMQERYALKRTDSRRRDRIFKRLRGVSEEEKEAIRIILTPIVSSALMIH